MALYYFSLDSEGVLNPADCEALRTTMESFEVLTPS